MSVSKGSLKFTITEVFNQGIVSALTECKQKKTKQINFQPDGSSLASSLFFHEHHRPKTNPKFSTHSQKG